MRGVSWSEGTREHALALVFVEFDLDSSGCIQSAELLALGKARRALGQRPGQWTEEKNTRLIHRINTSGDGCAAILYRTATIDPLGLLSGLSRSMSSLPTSPR